MVEKLQVSDTKITISLDDYDNVVGFVISRAAHILNRRFNDVLSDHGIDIRAREFPVLNRLHEHNSMTQTELCELTYPDHPAMTRMLDRLMNIGLVSKKIAEGDRRAFKVSLTPLGCITRNRAAQVVEEMLQSVCGDIDSDDLLNAVQVLHKIHAGANALPHSAPARKSRITRTGNLEKE